MHTPRIFGPLSQRSRVGEAHICNDNITRLHRHRDCPDLVPNPLVLTSSLLPSLLFLLLCCRPSPTSKCPHRLCTSLSLDTCSEADPSPTSSSRLIASSAPIKLSVFQEISSLATTWRLLLALVMDLKLGICLRVSGVLLMLLLSESGRGLLATCWSTLCPLWQIQWVLWRASAFNWL